MRITLPLLQVSTMCRSRVWIATQTQVRAMDASAIDNRTKASLWAKRNLGLSTPTAFVALLGAIFVAVAGAAGAESFAQTQLPLAVATLAVGQAQTGEGDTQAKAPESAPQAYQEKTSTRNGAEQTPPPDAPGQAVAAGGSPSAAPQSAASPGQGAASAPTPAAETSAPPSPQGAQQSPEAQAPQASGESERPQAPPAGEAGAQPPPSSGPRQAGQPQGPSGPTEGEALRHSGDLRQSPWLKLVVTALVLVLGLGLARVLAVQWRVPEFQGRFAVVLLSFFAGLAIVVMGWPPRRGIDLRGGVILVYEIEDQPVQTTPGEEPTQAAAGAVDMDRLIQAISRRVNPGGVLEVTIRPLGDTQIEVIIPEADREEVERLKRKISSAGTLEFRILANNRDHQPLIEQALAKEDRVLRDAEGRILAWWVPIARGQEENFPYPEIATRKRVDPRTRYEFTEVLVVKDPFDVTGAYLVHAGPGFDRTGAPAVYFTFNSEGGMRFGGLTGNNLPETGQVEFTRKLGIILDGYLYSAPAIRDTIFTHGEITGRFTREEVQDLVDILNAGSLPARLSEQPVSELVIGPTLGRDTVQRGMWAMVLSAVLVFVFMIVYYRFAGAVACLGLIQTVLLILAIMISIRAAFTLPGFAGLVLTLGMAVDANVLIYERIREEIRKGASLRMAIRNGFERAMSAIVDANLTTLITATVLYVIGRDQIRGFAVTLWLGVVVSMFAMLYCCRVIIELAERQRWITRLSMLQIIGTPRFPFMQKAPIAIGVSAALIVLGLIAVFVRGRGLLDIDFTGGVSIELEFVEPQDIAQVRARLSSEEVGLMDLAISDVRRLDDPVPGRHFIVNTSGVRGMNPDAPPGEVFAEVQRRLKQVFGRQLAHYSVNYTLLEESQAISTWRPAGLQPQSLQSDPRTGDKHLIGQAGWPLIFAGLLPGATQTAQEATTTQPQGASTSGEVPASAPPGESNQPAQPLAGQVQPPSPGPEAAPTTSQEAKTETPAQAEKPAQPSGPKTRAKLTFGQAVVYETVDQLVTQAIEQERAQGRIDRFIPYRISPVTAGGDVEVASTEWNIELDLAGPVAKEVLDLIVQRVNDTPYFPSINTVGGAVASGTRIVGIAAVLSSLVFIIAYIWVRFQRVIYGIAAVVALVHDVLITLGAIAASAFLANLLGFLLISEFKISLSVLAAFLTIIGYSLNDTIVVFDRIREVKGRAPRLTPEMVDRSINETLSRTILTSLTTLLVVVVLYIGGGPAIHAFAYSILVGIVVGTYSSIFIASPLLVWFSQWQERRQARARISAVRA
ncbi:MAG: protein translocase subunit SecD [Thermoguttaceae bacterium]|nr:protein translocase subunit SecD [Thermoguttaceae bacterium]MDW8077388.1 protein translocase subunit SecD [Thermoguttaceae bacterium]